MGMHQISLVDNFKLCMFYHSGKKKRALATPNIQIYFSCPSKLGGSSTLIFILFVYIKSPSVSPWLIFLWKWLISYFISTEWMPMSLHLSQGACDRSNHPPNMSCKRARGSIVGDSCMWSRLCLACPRPSGSVTSLVPQVCQHDLRSYFVWSFAYLIGH